MMDWSKIAKAGTATLLLVLLTLSPIAHHPAIAARGKKLDRNEAPPTKLAGKLTEVAPPAAIQELSQAFDDNQPQVSIQSPRPNEVLTDDTVSVQFQVKDLSLFKDKDLGLGPHLHVFLDNQPYQAVYDATKPLVLEKLTPGTHTIRAFASRPWHESFKNEGAYAQTTFHVYTKTGDNSPEANLPLLTYSRPQATYGAEPIMLDFYLTNAPLHLVAQADKKDDIADWRIRCTVNGDRFVLDQWQPVYLKGFKPGKNWVQLEFLDENGNPVKNVFNNTARVITYEPGGKDALSKLVRGELEVAEARGIVDATYKPPVPTPSPSPTPAPIASPTAKPTPSPAPIPVAPAVKVTPKAAPKPTPSVSPVPLMKPSPVSKPAASPVPVKSPEPVAIPKPVEIVPEGDRMERPKPVAVPKMESSKPESPKVERPRTTTPAPAKTSEIPTPKPTVAPEAAATPVPQTVKIPARPQPLVDDSQLAKETQSQATKKVDELKSRVTSQFDKLRDRFRAVTTPKPAPPAAKPTPSVAPTPTPPETPVTKLPIISVPQPSPAVSIPSSPQPAKVEPPKPEPEKPLTPAEQYYNRLRSTPPSGEPVEVK
ncbi:MAG: hypothetical protein NW224_21870 [Leptolyngbyaceae cyanobacterium bins.302]|nr:hypothetical protein [Leptolyngbyaceae cyanobacterium bins.302]